MKQERRPEDEAAELLAEARKSTADQRQRARERQRSAHLVKLLVALVLLTPATVINGLIVLYGDPGPRRAKEVFYFAVFFVAFCGTAYMFVRALKKERQEVARRKGGRCVHCSYPLMHAAATACPECGKNPTEIEPL